MKSTTSTTLVTATILLLICTAPGRAATIVRWDYETSGGVPVTLGQTAVGQIDDTGGHPGGPFDATGHGGTLSYEAGVYASHHALQFSEATSPIDYADLSLPAAIGAITQGAFTVETWFKTSDTSRGVLLGTYYGDIKNDLDFEVYNGKLRGHIGSPTAVTDFQSSGHPSVADGQWHHGAFVRDAAGGTVRLYLDGVQRGSTTDLSGSFTLDASTMYLGRDARTDFTRFDGYLDMTRISDVALTPEQFLIYSEQNYYRMETDGGVAVTGGQAASVVDDTGQHPIALDGAALPLSTAPPSYSNDVAGSILHEGNLLSNSHSLSFDGYDDYVELGNHSLLKTLPQDDFTVEFFLKTDTSEERAVILGTYDGDTAYIVNLEIGAEEHGANRQGRLRPFFESSGTHYDFWGTTDVSDDQWHHVAMVRSGAGTGSDLVQLFVDYELDGQMDLPTGKYDIRPDIFRIGGDSRGAYYYYEGLLDEFRITRGALNPEQFLRAVPEPATFTLLWLAAVGLVLPRRRRERIGA